MEMGFKSILRFKGGFPSIQFLIFIFCIWFWIVWLVCATTKPLY